MSRRSHILLYKEFSLFRIFRVIRYEHFHQLSFDRMLSQSMGCCFDHNTNKSGRGLLQHSRRNFLLYCGHCNRETTSLSVCFFFLNFNLESNDCFIYRLAIVGAFISLGMFLGSLTSAYAIDVLSMTAIFGIHSALMFTALLYITLFVAESLDSERLQTTVT